MVDILKVEVLWPEQMAPQLVVGVHQFAQKRIHFEKEGTTGRCFLVVPGAPLHGLRLERATPHRGTSEFFKQVLVAEGAGHDPASALTDTAAYKAAPLAISGNPPLSKSRCGCKASVKNWWA